MNDRSRKSRRCYYQHTIEQFETALPFVSGRLSHVLLPADSMRTDGFSLTCALPVFIMDDNRGLMIIRDTSHKHIQPLTLAYFRRDLIW